jgi:hypothetical protein
MTRTVTPSKAISTLKPTERVTVHTRSKNIDMRPTERPFRDWTNGELEALGESDRWALAEIDVNPSAWPDPEPNHAFLVIRITMAECEQTYRTWLSTSPLAPDLAGQREELAAIKAQIDLVAFVEKSLEQPLRRFGRHHRCRCPFHVGVTDTSFTVDGEKGLWHCFGCQRGGDVFTFAEEWFGCRSFGDAVDLVAREIGLVRTPKPVKRIARIHVGSVRVG